MNTMLSVYKCYNTKQKLFEFRPFCKIEEDDFFDLLTENEFLKAQNGKIQFNVSINKLIEKAKKIY
jgi:hypothetical protein